MCRRIAPQTLYLPTENDGNGGPGHLRTWPATDPFPIRQLKFKLFGWAVIVHKARSSSLFRYGAQCVTSPSLNKMGFMKVGQGSKIKEVTRQRCGFVTRSEKSVDLKYRFILAERQERARIDGSRSQLRVISKSSVPRIFKSPIVFPPAPVCCQTVRWGYLSNVPSHLREVSDNCHIYGGITTRGGMGLRRYWA